LDWLGLGLPFDGDDVPIAFCVEGAENANGLSIDLFGEAVDDPNEGVAEALPNDEVLFEEEPNGEEDEVSVFPNPPNEFSLLVCELPKKEVEELDDGAPKVVVALEPKEGADDEAESIVSMPESFDEPKLVVEEELPPPNANGEEEFVLADGAEPKVVVAGLLLLLLFVDPNAGVDEEADEPNSDEELDCEVGAGEPNAGFAEPKELVVVD
jgi:hypothetical protein